MAFQISPGVNVSEVDLTTVVPSTLTTAGAFAGRFQWGPANKIKLIRQSSDPGNPDIYSINLSRIEGIQQGNIVVQSNDIIFIESRRRFASRTLQEVTPIVSLLSTAITLYVLFTRL
jgi:polysaccharide export outer membrane protein